MLAGSCAAESDTQADPILDRGACDVLVQCAELLSPALVTEYEETFGEGGTCWAQGPTHWQTCRETCAAAIEAINIAGLATGDTCGICESDADCADFGDGFVCEGELCVAGQGGGDDEADVGEEGGLPSDLDGVSLLFVVDNTGSMASAQQTLAETAFDLVSQLDAAGISWRLGVTTTDDGGNPWCGSTTPEAGQLVHTACTQRLGDFEFSNTDSAAACTSVCSASGIPRLPSTTVSTGSSSLERPWIESAGGQTNLDGMSVNEALRCMLPQGTNGCGFEGQLESALLAVDRATTSGNPSFGFVDDQRLLVIVLVTDEADCSTNPEWTAIFEEDGGKTFWSDPELPFPTSAVCWNAGVACVGSPSNYDTCDPIDRQLDGSATSNPDAAVLWPVERYVDNLGQGAGAVMTFGVVGVQSDGTPRWADTGEAGFLDSFGIGPGCSASNPFEDPFVDGDEFLDAVPPARAWAVLNALGPADGQAAYSICGNAFDGAMAKIGVAIVSAMEG